jgi:hypothetical protein
MDNSSSEKETNLSSSQEEQNLSSPAFRPPTAAPTTEIPILYFSTHGVFDVETDVNQIEEEQSSLGLAIPIPRNMTILKYNFVPINVCNYGGIGTIGQKNIPNSIHELISTQLDPATIMARYGFESFLLGDSERTNSIILNSGLEQYKYKGSKFIDVPLEFYKLLYDVAQSQGLEEETILDKIMSELNDCKVNDIATSDSELSEIEIESIMRGNNVRSKNAMMMKIIDECVKKGVKDLKAELKEDLVKGNKALENLHKKILHPRLLGTALSHKGQKEIINTFNKEPEVRTLKQGINDVKAYLNHIDDLAKSSHWNISIPNKSGKARYILNKTFTLQPENKRDGIDWNITMFNPKTGTRVEDTRVEDTPLQDTPVEDTPVEDTPVEDTPLQDTPVEDTRVEDIFGLKEENKIPGTLRKMTLKYILEHLNDLGMKTVILLDQTCSVFREFTPDLRRVNVEGNVERKWANTVRKLNEGDTIYGGKRKKHKTKKHKTKKRKTQKRKTQKRKK